MEIADGKYKGRAKAPTGTLIASNEKNTPGYSVEMLFTDPVMQGATMTWTGWLSDSAADRTIESLRTMGWTGDDIDQVSGLDANEVELVVQAEEYQGKRYPRIAFVNRLGSLAMGTPMQPDEAKSFAAQMKARVRAFDAAGGRKPGAKKAPAGPNGQHPRQGGAIAPEPPPLTDDDLPF